MGKGRLKERCGLESQTKFFTFKKLPKTECGLDSRIYGTSFIFLYSIMIAFFIKLKYVGDCCVH